MADWLTAIDDLLVSRHAHCLLCGRPTPGDAWHAVCEVGHGHAIAYTLCLHCKAHDSNRDQVHALLVQRYERKEER